MKNLPLLVQRALVHRLHLIAAPRDAVRVSDPAASTVKAPVGRVPQRESQQVEGNHAQTTLKYLKHDPSARKRLSNKRQEDPTRLRMSSIVLNRSKGLAMTAEEAAHLRKRGYSMHDVDIWTRLWKEDSAAMSLWRWKKTGQMMPLFLLRRILTQRITSKETTYELFDMCRSRFAAMEAGSQKAVAWQLCQLSVRHHPDLLPAIAHMVCTQASKVLMRSWFMNAFLAKFSLCPVRKHTEARGRKPSLEAQRIVLEKMNSLGIALLPTGLAAQQQSAGKEDPVEKLVVPHSASGYEAAGHIHGPSMSLASRRAYWVRKLWRTQNVDQAAAVFDDLRASKCVPDSDCWCALLDKAARNDGLGIDVLQRLFAELEKDGLRIDMPLTTSLLLATKGDEQCFDAIKVRVDLDQWMHHRKLRAQYFRCLQAMGKVDQAIQQLLASNEQEPEIWLTCMLACLSLPSGDHVWYLYQKCSSRGLPTTPGILQALAWAAIKSHGWDGMLPWKRVSQITHSYLFFPDGGRTSHHLGDACWHALLSMVGQKAPQDILLELIFLLEEYYGSEKPGEKMQCAIAYYVLETGRPEVVQKAFQYMSRWVGEWPSMDDIARYRQDEVRYT